MMCLPPGSKRTYTLFTLTTFFRSVVRDGDLHPTLGGDQAGVSDGDVAEGVGELAGVGAHRASGPVGHELQVRPEVLRQQPAGPLDRLFQPDRKSTRLNSSH